MLFKNKAQILFIFVLLLSISGLQAQFSLDEFKNIQKLKKVPLLVLMETPNKGMVQRLEKKNPEELKNYLAAIKGKNDALKASIKNDWKISSDVKFVDKSTLKNYRTPENKGKYAYMTAKVGNKIKWKKSSTGYLTYTDYSVFILGDYTPIITKRFGDEYNAETKLTSKNITTALNDIQKRFDFKETQVAKRNLKRSMRKESRLAKNTFTEE